MSDLLMQEPWTAEEVAQYLKLSPKNGFRTIQRWVREGRLKCGRVGDCMRFRKEDVDNCLFATMPKRGY